MRHSLCIFRFSFRLRAGAGTGPEAIPFLRSDRNNQGICDTAWYAILAEARA